MPTRAAAIRELLRRGLAVETIPMTHPVLNGYLFALDDGAAQSAASVLGWLRVGLRKWQRQDGGSVEYLLIVDQITTPAIDPAMVYVVDDSLDRLGRAAVLASGHNLMDINTTLDGEAPPDNPRIQG
jgi:hypothetical protein